VILGPTDDAHVNSGSPNSSYGLITVSGLTGPVASAKLRLFVTEVAGPACNQGVVVRRHHRVGPWACGP
jgi:hypothetical protein